MKNTTHNPYNQIYRVFFKLIKQPNAQLIQDEQSATSHIIFPEPDELKEGEQPIDLHLLTRQHFDLSDLDFTITGIPNAIVITIEH